MHAIFHRPGEKHERSCRLSNFERFANGLLDRSLSLHAPSNKSKQVLTAVEPNMAENKARGRLVTLAVVFFLAGARLLTSFCLACSAHKLAL